MKKYGYFSNWQIRSWVLPEKQELKAEMFEAFASSNQEPVLTNGRTFSSKNFVKFTTIKKLKSGK